MNTKVGKQHGPVFQNQWSVDIVFYTHLPPSLQVVSMSVVVFWVVFVCGLFNKDVSAAREASEMTLGY
jgi:hypothetical protein